MQITLKETADLLKNQDYVYILSHQSPDGDTIGSAHALYHALKVLGKHAKILCCDEFAYRYDYITKKYTDEEFEPKFIVAVDVADPALLGSLNKVYGNKVNLCIDHHVSNLMYAEKTYLCHTSASNCENMYDVITEMLGKCTDDIAEAIYTGIVTDSGCFKYSSVNARTHEIAAELMNSNNINYAWITRQMIEIKSKARLALESEMLNRVEYFHNDECAVICITLELMDKLGLKSSDLEGIAGIMLQIENVKVGITMKEKEGGFFKVSMRSPNEVNVSEICKEFDGGGHINAAGCKIYGATEDVKKKLVDAVCERLERN